MGDFNRGFNRGPREMHKATCSKCKQECEVPFKPSEGRPVYCRDCFAKVRDNPEEAVETKQEEPEKAAESEESEEEQKEAA